MPCYHPKRGFVVGLTDDNKPKLKILDFKYLSVGPNGQPSTLPGREEDGDITAHYLIPCGHCLGCRQQQANEWTNRLLMESKYHDSMYFVTLTYDNDHLPANYEVDEETGELKGGFTLSKRDCQLFMKRLRKAFPADRIRYYLAGEYGPTTGRPHYHAILFGLHVNDLEPSGMSETGNPYYISKQFGEIWSKGFTSIEPANDFTIRYVTGYITKKLGEHPNEEFEKNGITPPFALSSRRPGLGLRYLEDHLEKVESDDHITLATCNGSVSFDLPRYFRKKLVDFGYEEVVTERSLRKVRNAENAVESRSELTDLNQLEQLAVREYGHQKRISLRNKL